MQHDTKALSVSYGNFGLVWLAHCHRASDPGLGVQNQRPGPGSSGGGNQTCPFLLIRCTTVFTQVYMIQRKRINILLHVHEDFNVHKFNSMHWQLKPQGTVQALGTEIHNK